MRYVIYDSKDEEIAAVFDGQEATDICQENLGSYLIKEFPCKHCGEYKEDVQERTDFHGITTGYWCEEDYESNYPYRKDDYTNGTGVADDGTPIEENY
jgi:hypothetical protein